jgi:hypothetical protein
VRRRAGVTPPWSVSVTGNRLLRHTGHQTTISAVMTLQAQPCHSPMSPSTGCLAAAIATRRQVNPTAHLAKPREAGKFRAERDPAGELLQATRGGSRRRAPISGHATWANPGIVGSFRTGMTQGSEPELRRSAATPVDRLESADGPRGHRS